MPFTQYSHKVIFKATVKTAHFFHSSVKLMPAANTTYEYEYYFAFNFIYYSYPATCVFHIRDVAQHEGSNYNI